VTRDERDFVVFGFDSTHDALAAEALLKDLGVPVLPVPPPRHLGACGIGLRVEPSDVDRAAELLERASIHVASRVPVRDR
jgi:hypothetical protein